MHSPFVYILVDDHRRRELPKSAETEARRVRWRSHEVQRRSLLMQDASLL
jgi:predicted DNA-binding transcriptional regulator AlpA